MKISSTMPLSNECKLLERIMQSATQIISVTKFNELEEGVVPHIALLLFLCEKGRKEIEAASKGD